MGEMVSQVMPRLLASFCMCVPLLHNRHRIACNCIVSNIIIQCIAQSRLLHSGLHSSMPQVRQGQATAFQVQNIRIAYVFYESGLSINVMYDLDDPGKRAVGFKLSEGMDVPDELASRFKFARQKSKLAGTIRGSYFAFKNDY